MKHHSQVHLQLSVNSEVPIYQQIKSYIINEIKRGRLLPGAQLPGSRVLAQQLRVNRNTVILAYEHLAAEGWIATQYKSGTRISDPIPQELVSPDTPEAEAKPSLDITFRKFAPPQPLPYNNGTFDTVFDEGQPDGRLSPIPEITREVRKILHQQTTKLHLKNYNERGNEQLLQEINLVLNNDRGLAAVTENICVTHGHQDSLFLVAQTLIFPGDHVAVEHPGYQPAWEAFRLTGAHLHYIPVDEQGIDVEALAVVCQHTSLKAVYITPHHQYPTTTTLPAARRKLLLELSEQYHFMIIEDDYDHNYHFDAQPVLPVAGMPHADNVVYIGSVAPSIPLSFVYGPVEFIHSLASCQMVVSQQRDRLLEQGMANLMAEGEIRRYLQQTHATYKKRLTLTSGILEVNFTGIADFTIPKGGLAIWIRLHQPLQISQLHEAGIYIVNPNSFYAPHYNGQTGLRLGFASLEENAIVKGLDKLAKILQR